MTLANFDVFGVIVAPLMPLAVGVLAAWFMLRRVLVASGLTRWLWHPALFDAALFLVVLCAIVLLLEGTDARG